MFSIPIISFLLFLPIISIFVIVTINNKSNFASKNIYYITVLTSFIHLILSIYLWLNFAKISFGYQFVEEVNILSYLNYIVGLDGISLLFVIFTSAIFFLVFLVFPFPENNVKIYSILMLLILFASTGLFVSLDIMLFYIFYEMAMIPVFFLLVIFGCKNSSSAAFKFIMYTVFASIFMLIAFISLVMTVNTSFIPDMVIYAIPYEYQRFLFIFLFISLAIKSAIFPFHGWMPETYKNAPFALNVILSAILFKFGIYGMIKLMIPMFPLAFIDFYQYVYFICLFTMIYAGYVSFKQDNMKLAFVYLSISHMALIVAGIFSTNIYAIEGAIFQSLSHSLYSSAVFILIYYIYERFKSVEFKDVSGISSQMPILSILLFVVGLSAMAFPLTNAFIGEFLILFGIFNNYRIFALFFSLSILIGAIFVARIYKEILFGEPKEGKYNDISVYNAITLSVIIFFIFFMGIDPDVFLDFIHVSVSNLMEQFRNGINYDILN